MVTYLNIHVNRNILNVDNSILEVYSRLWMNVLRKGGLNGCTLKHAGVKEQVGN